MSDWELIHPRLFLFSTDNERSDGLSCRRGTVYQDERRQKRDVTGGKEKKQTTIW